MKFVIIIIIIRSFIFL